MDTVLIVGEGGPKYSLDFEGNGRVYWEYLKNHSNYYIAVIHQSNTYNRSIFPSGDFEVEDAVYERDMTTEIMHRSISYFKSRGKYVVVFGHSYSAFVAMHYLATKESSADKYIITAGRIEPNPVQVQYQLKAMNAFFEEDGITLIVPDETESPNPYRRARYFTIRRNISFMKYAYRIPEYKNLLKYKDLSDVYFIYGALDQNVGALTKAEIEFLDKRNAKVIAVKEDHYSVWKRVVDAIHSGQIRL